MLVQSFSAVTRIETTSGRVGRINVDAKYRIWYICAMFLADSPILDPLHWKGSAYASSSARRTRGADFSVSSSMVVDQNI